MVKTNKKASNKYASCYINDKINLLIDEKLKTVVNNPKTVIFTSK